MTERRLELEALLKCPLCRGVPYKLFRRETKPDTGIFTNVLWPTAPGTAPPADMSLTCPNDGATLVRVAP